MNTYKLVMNLAGLLLISLNLWAFQSIPRVGDDGVRPPVFTKRIAPEYPVDAVASGVQGYVILEAVLGKEGTIRDVQVLRDIADGDLGFAEAARAALMAWEYKPAQINGLPSDVRMTVKIDFQLDHLRLNLLSFETADGGTNLAKPEAISQNIAQPTDQDATLSLPITVNIAPDGSLLGYQLPESVKLAFADTAWLMAEIERRMQDLTFKPARNRAGGLQTEAIFQMKIPLAAAQQ